MDFATTAIKLASLGHEQRLRLFYVLIQAGREGLTVGQIQEALGRPMSTVSFHLRELVNAGMVVQEKQGRSVYNRASFETLNEMMALIARDCCQGVPVTKPPQS